MPEGELGVWCEDIRGYALGGFGLNRCGRALSVRRATLIISCGHVCHTCGSVCQLAGWAGLP